LSPRPEAHTPPPEPQPSTLHVASPEAADGQEETVTVVQAADGQEETVTVVQELSAAKSKDTNLTEVLEEANGRCAQKDQEILRYKELLQQVTKSSQLLEAESNTLRGRLEQSEELIQQLQNSVRLQEVEAKRLRSQLEEKEASDSLRVAEAQKEMQEKLAASAGRIGQLQASILQRDQQIAQLKEAAEAEASLAKQMRALQDEKDSVQQRAVDAEAKVTSLEVLLARLTQKVEEEKNVLRNSLKEEFEEEKNVLRNRLKEEFEKETAGLRELLSQGNLEGKAGTPKSKERVGEAQSTPRELQPSSPKSFKFPDASGSESARSPNRSKLSQYELQALQQRLVAAEKRASGEEARRKEAERELLRKEKLSQKAAGTQERRNPASQTLEELHNERMARVKADQQLAQLSAQFQAEKESMRQQLSLQKQSFQSELEDMRTKMRQSEDALSASRAGGASAAGKEAELVRLGQENARLLQDNANLQAQLAQTWSQINEQSRKLEEERAQCMEELAHVRQSAEPVRRRAAPAWAAPTVAQQARAAIAAATLLEAPHPQVGPPLMRATSTGSSTSTTLAAPRVDVSAVVSPLRARGAAAVLSGGMSARSSTASRGLSPSSKAVPVNREGQATVQRPRRATNPGAVIAGTGGLVDEHRDARDEIFDRMDVNRDGIITRDEFEKFVAVPGNPVSRKLAASAAGMHAGARAAQLPAPSATSLPLGASAPAGLLPVDGRRPNSPMDRKAMSFQPASTSAAKVARPSKGNSPVK